MYRFAQSGRIISGRVAFSGRSGLRRYTSEATGSSGSHLLAGVGGGAFVLAGIYAYYRYSGTAELLHQTKNAMSKIPSAKDLVESAPSPKDALRFLRSASKFYLGAIPGVSGGIDQAFDKLDAKAEEHAEEISEIVEKAMAEIKKALEGGVEGGVGIVKTLTDTMEKLQEVGKQQGAKLLDGLYAKAPELKNILGSVGTDFQKLTDENGPEARKIAESTYTKAREIIKDEGMSKKSYEKIKELFGEKTKEVKEIAKKSGADVWAAGAKASKPFLDSVPDVQKTLDSALGSIKGYVGEKNAKAVQELYEKLEKIGKGDKSLDEKAKEAKELVEKSSVLEDVKKAVKDAVPGGDNDWNLGSLSGLMSGAGLSGLAGSIPSLGQITKDLDGDWDALVKLAQSGEGKKKAEELLHSTVGEMQELLKKKMEEAKELSTEVIEGKGKGDEKDKSKGEAKEKEKGK